MNIHRLAISFGIVCALTAASIPLILKLPNTIEDSMKKGYRERLAKQDAAECASFWNNTTTKHYIDCLASKKMFIRSTNIAITDSDDFMALFAIIITIIASGGCALAGYICGNVLFLYSVKASQKWIEWIKQP